MFFILGISNGEKKIKFDQLEVCKQCGRYGHIEIYMRYMYFMFFFLPIFKWNKRYYAKMSCCDSMCELSKEVGEEISKGNLTHLSMEEFIFHSQAGSMKCCFHCGFATRDGYQYCPKCGSKL